MSRNKLVVVVLILIGVALTASAKPSPSVDVSKFHAMGYVVVSPNGPGDGADFGPGTPGTKTSGIQEAIDYAKANAKDVYLAGGGEPKTFTWGAYYRTYDTIRIPPMQNFKLDGGEAFIFYQKQDGIIIDFDSQMSCRYKLGVVAPSKEGFTGTTVRIKPRKKGPDNFCVVTTTVFDINALVGGSSTFVQPNHKGLGIALHLDGSDGSIDCNVFNIVELIAADKGLYLSKACTNNWIKVTDLHLCNTHLQIGDAGDSMPRFNRIDAHIQSHGIKDSIGARIFGIKNLLTLDVAEAGKGRDIIFEKEARDNLITALHLPDGITNNADVPTNKITTAYPMGFKAITTPAVPKSGEALISREPYTVQIIVLTPGQVSDWTLTDANGEPTNLQGGLTVGQQITLEPADRITLNYTEAPSWRWKAMR